MAIPNNLVASGDLSSPEYEKNIFSKFPAYNLYMRFVNCPIPEEKLIVFPAYIKKVGDQYTPTFNDREVYGRMDSIPIYSRTSRQITFDLDLPSNGLAHSREIATKLNILVKNLYPSYQKNGSVNIISSPPLVEVFFSDFIYDKFNNAPILGYFKSGVSINHDLSKGVFARDGGFEAYPRSYSLSFTLNVLHRYTPGYQVKGSKVFNPVNILGRS